MSMRKLFSRSAIWLYALLFLPINIVVLIAISRALAPSLLIEHDSGLAVDHIAFWAAGWLANHGDPAAAYDHAALAAVQSAGLGYEYIDGMSWFYPPLAQVLAQPFAFLSLPWSFIVWNTVGMLAFTYVSWRILPDPLAVLLAAISGGLAALFSGQIGLFIASIAGLCMLSLRRAESGGVWLAFLLLKPQTVFAIPVALALSGRWRSIVIACLVGAGLIAASVVWLGVDVWLTFLGTLGGTADFFLIGAAVSVLWDQYVSVYGVALNNGASFWAAALLQAIFSVAALGCAAWSLHRLGPTDAALAIILYAAVVAAPRIFTYDLPLLALGALFHARAALSKGWTWWEPPLFAAGFLLLELSFIVLFQAAALIGPAFLIGACYRHAVTAQPRCN